MTAAEYYYTLEEPGPEVLYKEKGSKFYARAYPVRDEDEAKDILAAVKAEHYKARHWCYAWRMGAGGEHERANDDGEPSHSAGQPILGQIRAFSLSGVMVVVVRYFGGVKLGVGGLIRAYKTAARDAIEQATVVRKELLSRYEIRTGYENMNKIQQLVKRYRLSIVSTEMQDECLFVVDVPGRVKRQFLDETGRWYKIKVKKL